MVRKQNTAILRKMARRWGVKTYRLAETDVTLTTTDTAMARALYRNSTARDGSSFNRVPFFGGDLQRACFNDGTGSAGQEADMSW